MTWVLRRWPPPTVRRALPPLPPAAASAWSSPTWGWMTVSLHSTTVSSIFQLIKLQTWLGGFFPSPWHLHQVAVWDGSHLRSVWSFHSQASPLLGNSSRLKVEMIYFYKKKLNEKKLTFFKPTSVWHSHGAACIAPDQHLFRLLTKYFLSPEGRTYPLLPAVSIHLLPFLLGFLGWNIFIISPHFRKYKKYLSDSPVWTSGSQSWPPCHLDFL